MLCVNLWTAVRLDAPIDVLGSWVFWFHFPNQCGLQTAWSLSTACLLFKNILNDAHLSSVVSWVRFRGFVRLPAWRDNRLNVMWWWIKWLSWRCHFPDLLTLQHVSTFASEAASLPINACSRSHTNTALCGCTQLQPLCVGAPKLYSSLCCGAVSVLSMRGIKGRRRFWENLFE